MVHKWRVLDGCRACATAEFQYLHIFGQIGLRELNLVLVNFFVGDRLATILRRNLVPEVPAPVLKGSIRRQEVYDDPYRSARGRTITHAFYMELEPNASLPKVKGGDDARQARWVPLGELTPERLFEDHYFIIQDILGLI